MNSLEEADLLRAGLRILRRAEGAGVDAFDGGPFLFLQGHPEYEADTLKAEYRRDFKRFLRGERDAPPGLPLNYFDAEGEGRLAELEMDAGSLGADIAVARLEAVLAGAAPESTWRPAAIELYRTWLSAAGRGERRARA
jgi:homoserine O-succinyltransferase